ncbi:unnamed protein product [Musa acuminata subsp. burmannicoides]
MCRSKNAVNVFFSSPHRRPFCLAQILNRRLLIILQWTDLIVNAFPLVVHWRNKLWIRIPLPQILRVCQSRNLRTTMETCDFGSWHPTLPVKFSLLHSISISRDTGGINTVGSISGPHSRAVNL